VLAKPIVEIADVAKISKHISPYFMRRTFQALCRAASVHDFVARSIAALQQRERKRGRDGLAKVISLAEFRLAQKSSAGGDRDLTGGDRGSIRRKLDGD
jgi:hypothetical protein